MDSIINAVIKKLHTEHFGLAERFLPSPGLHSSECWVVYLAPLPSGEWKGECTSQGVVSALPGCSKAKCKPSMYKLLPTSALEKKRVGDVLFTTYFLLITGTMRLGVSSYFLSVRKTSKQACHVVQTSKLPFPFRTSVIEIISRKILVLFFSTLYETCSVGSAMPQSSCVRRETNRVANMLGQKHRLHLGWIFKVVSLDALLAVYLVVPMG